MLNGWSSVRIRMDEINCIPQTRREKLSFYTSLPVILRWLSS